jgi:hypothetical protein
MDNADNFGIREAAMVTDEHLEDLDLQLGLNCQLLLLVWDTLRLLCI